MKAGYKVNMVKKVVVQLIDGRRVARLRISGNHDYSDIDAKVINPRTRILMRKYSTFRVRIIPID